MLGVGHIPQRLHQTVVRLPPMLGQGALHRGVVAIGHAQRRDQHIVLIERIAHGLLAARTIRVSDLGLSEQRPIARAQMPALAEVDYCLMEIGVTLAVSQYVIPLQGCLANGHAVLEGFNCACSQLAAAAGHLQRQTLDPEAHVDEVDEILGFEVDHPGAAARPKFDEAFGGQHAQRVFDGRHADVEVRGDLRVQHTAAGGEAWVGHGDALAQRAGDPLSGNAGLFGSAADVSAIGQLWLDGGIYAGERVLAPRIVTVATSDQTPGLNAPKGLGWFLNSRSAPLAEELVPARSNSAYLPAEAFTSPWQPRSCGELLSDRAFGHIGFTGTSLWIDPTRSLVAALLTNRIHPAVGDGAALASVRARFHNALAAALSL